MNLEEFKVNIFSLSDRLYPMVARLLGSDTLAKDALQEIMIKLWSHRNKLKGHPNPSGFVFLTARNYCLDQIKSNKPKYLSEEHLPETSGTNNSDALEYKELLSTVHNILASCEIKHSEVLILRDIDGIDIKEIATMMNLNPPHVRVILSRTRNYVQQELLKNFQYEYGER